MNDFGNPVLNPDSKPERQFGIIFRLAIPVVLSQVSHTMVALADTLMIGQTNDVSSLAAASLANNLFSLAIVFGIGISYGATPKVAESHARGETETCSLILKNSLINNLLWSILLVGVLLALLPFASHLGQVPEVLRRAIPFFKLLTFSLPGILLFQAFKQFFDGLGNTKPGMVFSLSANLLNVILNYLLIFGHFGFPEMGIIGAGIATLISRIAMGVALGIYFFVSPSTKKFRAHFVGKWVEPTYLLLLNRIGLPISLQFLFEVGAFSFMAILIGKMGAPALAAHQVVITIASATYMMSSGLAAAATVRVGHFVGLGNRAMIRLSGIRSFQIVLVFMGTMAVLLILFRNTLPLAFINNAEVVDASARLLLIAGFFQISDGIQVVGLGCLRGLSDVKIPTWFTFMAYWVIAIPFGYVFGIFLGYGLEATWWALSLGLTISALLMLFRFFSLCKTVSLDKNDEAYSNTL